MIRLRPSGVDEILIKRVQDWYEPGPGVFITSTSTLFTPAQLFTGTTTGVWYDPSDLTTLYRDAAGTLPVTAVEQPVGLMLDKSKGLVLGPELVTNGDFSNGTTGWSGQANVTLSIENGELKGVTTSAFNTFAYQDEVTVVGKWYKATATLRCASGNMALEIYNGAFATKLTGATLTTPTANTKISVYFVATGTSTRISFGSSTVATTYYADNISVRELPGNHAFNSSGNSANFPVLSAKYNLLTKTEDFSDAVWTKFNSTVTANSNTAPDGTATADRITATGDYPFVSQDIAATSTNQFLWRYSIQKTTGLADGSLPTISVEFRTAAASLAEFGAVVNTNTGQAIPASGWGTSAFSSISVADQGSYWAVSATTPAAPANTTVARAYVGVSGGFASGTRRTTSFPLTSIVVWGADLRVANDALNQPAYQRVNTSTDYDTVGFKPYLRFNGTNQWLQTNSIDFTYGDKMFVSAGVRKLGSSGSGLMLVELSASAAAYSGTFFLAADTGGLDRPGFYSQGTSPAYPEGGSVLPPVTQVLSGVGNISGDQAIIRVNGSQAAISTADQGTGNYGNYPLYIGSRGGGTVWFNGRLYQMVVAGKQASAAEITSTETYINQKTGAF